MEVVDTFNADSAVYVKECQDFMASNSITSDLTFLKCHLSFLPPAITKLETAGLPINEALSIIAEVETKILQVPGDVRKLLQDKATFVLGRNPGLETFCQVGRVLLGQEDGALSDGITPGEAGDLKFCPLTSTDVEQSFYVYKNNFSDQHHSFTENNLSRVVVANLFYNRLNSE